MRKFLSLIVFFYILALLQTSLLAPFKSVFISSNLIIIVVIIFNLFESEKSWGGIFSAFFGGFFMDIFSSGLIGFYILFLIALAIFIKLVFKRYVHIPIIKMA